MIQPGERVTITDGPHSGRSGVCTGRIAIGENVSIFVRLDGNYWQTNIDEKVCKSTAIAAVNKHSDAVV